MLSAEEFKKHKVVLFKNEDQEVAIHIGDVDQIDLNAKGPWSHIKSEKKRRQYCLSRMLLSNMIKNEEALNYRENGKPFLKMGPYISLSHSNEMVGVSINAKHETGIDVQEFTLKIDKIKSKFCHFSELEMSENSSSRMDCLHFIWSAKEAVFKFFGENILFAEQMHVATFDPINDQNISLDLLDRAGSKTHIFKLNICKRDKYYIAYIVDVEVL